MTQGHLEDGLRRAVTVAVPAKRAFVAFTTEPASWWPPEYTWAGAVLEAIAVEPHECGRCLECGPHGFEGEGPRSGVLPPAACFFSCQIGPDRAPQPDPARTSEVEVRFAEEGTSSTGVELEHRCFARHGEGGAGYRDALDAPEGWTYMLDRYVAAPVIAGPR